MSTFSVPHHISLAKHSLDVENLARDFALHCGLSSRLAEHVALAGWLHDVGKADRRFQLMLRGGSEIEYFKDETTWAKSAIPQSAREAHRLAQKRSGYPLGARHEVQSLAMLERQQVELTQRLMEIVPGEYPDLDLVFHLVASHHGFCRPFAPVVSDDAPEDVSLTGHTSAVFHTIDFSSTPSNHGMHRLDSPLGERYWTLIAKYGWHELCWLEALLRLADHRASEEESYDNWCGTEKVDTLVMLPPQRFERNPFFQTPEG